MRSTYGKITYTYIVPSYVRYQKIMYVSYVSHLGAYYAVARYPSVRPSVRYCAKIAKYIVDILSPLIAQAF